MDRGSARLCSRRQWSREGISRYLLCEPLWLKTKKSLTTEGTEGHRGKPAQLVQNRAFRSRPDVERLLAFQSRPITGEGRRHFANNGESLHVGRAARLCGCTVGFHQRAFNPAALRILKLNAKPWAAMFKHLKFVFGLSL